MKKTKAMNYLSLFLIPMIVLFVTISLIVVPSKDFMRLEIFKQISYSETSTNIFLNALGGEIPQFSNILKNEFEIPPLSKITLENTTRFITDDLSLSGLIEHNLTSLLSNEIPGFDVSHTEIYIAGKGSDYSNLPVESPAPDFDELLKQEELNKASQEKKEPEVEKYVHHKNDPSVFIYHSHSWEGYLPLINRDVKPSDASSVDNSQNVVLVGSLLANQFKEYGIETIQNKVSAAKALKDKGWDYRNSYELSREQVKTVSSQNKNIKYLIDIHRDSARKESTTITFNGKKYARLYFVVGQAHKNYEENLAFTKAVHERLEEIYPGLSKGVYIKTKAEGNGIYNQDLSSKSLLLEVGGIDNNKEELNYTVEAFAKVFKDIYEGDIKVNANK